MQSQQVMADDVHCSNRLVFKFSAQFVSLCLNACSNCPNTLYDIEHMIPGTMNLDQGRQVIVDMYRNTRYRAPGTWTHARHT